MAHAKAAEEKAAEAEAEAEAARAEERRQHLRDLVRYRGDIGEI